MSEGGSFGDNARSEWHSRPVSTLAALLTLAVVIGGAIIQLGGFRSDLAVAQRDIKELRDSRDAQTRELADKEARIRVLESRLTLIEAAANSAARDAAETLRLVRSGVEVK